MPHLPRAGSRSNGKMPAMTHIKRFGAAAMLLAPAASQSPRASSTTGANPADARFITDAYRIIEFDRQEGQLAQTQAKDPRVKALAAKLTGEANEYVARIAPLAAEAGIRPPGELRNDLQVRLGHMRLQNGLDFDRTYLDDQIASHEEVVLSEGAMTPQEHSQPLIGVARSALDLIRRNLADLRALRQQIGPGR